MDERAEALKQLHRREVKKNVGEENEKEEQGARSSAVNRDSSRPAAEPECRRKLRGVCLGGFSDILLLFQLAGIEENDISWNWLTR